MMIRHAFPRVVAIAALLIAVAGFGVAAPANAASTPIAVSLDGTTWGDHLSTALFAGAVIVPGTALTQSFWIKNRASTPGNLAVAVQDIDGTDASMVAALSVSADSGTHSGSDVAFSTVNPCRSLLSGVGVQPGDEVRVDVKLKLSSSLSHLSSQSGVGSFNVRVVLTSTDVAPPSGCSSATPPGGGGGGDPVTATTPAGEIDSEVIAGAASGSVPDQANGLHNVSGTGTGSGFRRAVEPNTARFFQEFDVTWWLIALMLGGLFAWYRRRNMNPEEAY